MCEYCGSTGVCRPRCPNAPDPKIHGYCEQCGAELREDYEYYTDNGGSKYCSFECAIEYNGIKSREWDYKEDN